MFSIPAHLVAKTLSLATSIATINKMQKVDAVSHMHNMMQLLSDLSYQPYSGLWDWGHIFLI